MDESIRSSPAAHKEALEDAGGAVPSVALALILLLLRLLLLLLLLLILVGAGGPR